MFESCSESTLASPVAWRVWHLRLLNPNGLSLPTFIHCKYHNIIFNVHITSLLDFAIPSQHDSSSCSSENLAEDLKGRY